MWTMKTQLYRIVIVENKRFQNNFIVHWESFKNGAKNITIIVDRIASYVVFNIIGYNIQGMISIASKLGIPRDNLVILWLYK